MAGFGGYVPGSPGRAPLLPPIFFGDYSIYAGGEQYDPYQYFPPGTNSYTIVLKFEGSDWSDDPLAGGFGTVRVNVVPGTPLKEITKKIIDLITAIIEKRILGLDTDLSRRR